MVGGMGYMAGKATANRAAQGATQEERPPESQPAAASASPSATSAPPAATGGGSSAGGTFEQLKQLGELRDSGVLTPEEFEREKQKILAAG